MNKDPLFNAIYSGIKLGISAAFDAKAFGSGLTLIYCGIDSMAWLNMPSGQTDVTRTDFVDWVDSYFDRSFTSQVTGEELYSARCAVVHTYTNESRSSRSGARMIGYKLGGSPPINFDPRVDKDVLIMELGYFKDAFFKSIDDFLMKAFMDSNKGKLIDQRSQKLLIAMPYKGINQPDN